VVPYPNPFGPLPFNNAAIDIGAEEYRIGAGRHQARRHQFAVLIHASAKRRRIVTAASRVDRYGGAQEVPHGNESS
jgi:hypothetical protein